MKTEIDITIRKIHNGFLIKYPAIVSGFYEEYCKDTESVLERIKKEMRGLGL